ncbi:MAG: transposase [Gemmatimonadetes bacterium]|nr:transposase [Gemmatimonadota bacterium]MBT5326254.1 transposase [Gemmatimonadota bacterium]MBT5452741.1 transposase [Gemmatimonadota bacterium]MBT5800366.1 transposase [Gemmatimonadota bacterium]MBT6619521.1 transposase [Gemmatimonadota bacterium]
MVRILRQADGGETAQAVCRTHNISEQTFYRWKKKYGDMELADAKRLKELEK